MMLDFPVDIIKIGWFGLGTANKRFAWTFDPVSPWHQHILDYVDIWEGKGVGQRRDKLVYRIEKNRPS